MISGYTKLIEEIDPTVNAVGIECLMRLQYRTLDHLPRDVFSREIAMARRIEAVEDGFLRSCADSYGLLEDFDEYERKLAEEEPLTPYESWVRLSAEIGAEGEE